MFLLYCIGYSFVANSDVLVLEIIATIIIVVRNSIVFWFAIRIDLEMPWFGHLNG